MPRRGGAARALDDLFEGQGACVCVFCVCVLFLLFLCWSGGNGGAGAVVGSFMCPAAGRRPFPLRPQRTTKPPQQKQTGWAFAAAHPGLQLLAALNPHQSHPVPHHQPQATMTVVPPAQLLEGVAARRARLARAAQADVERAERAAAERVAAAELMAAAVGGLGGGWCFGGLGRGGGWGGGWMTHVYIYNIWNSPQLQHTITHIHTTLPNQKQKKQEMARLDALLAAEARREAAALAPLLRRKDRAWAAIDG